MDKVAYYCGLTIDYVVKEADMDVNLQGKLL